MSDKATATTAVRPETSGRGPRFPHRIALSGCASAFAQPATYLGIAMLAVVYAVVAFLIASDRQEAAHTAQRNGENIVRIIDESYSNVFQNIDSSLQYVRRAYQESPSTFNMSDWVQEAAIRNNLAFNFIITDARGRVINEGRTVAETNVTSVIGIEIGDHDVFVQQANASVDSLAVSPPLTLNASLGPVIALSRRMTAPDGSFAGVVLALINPIALGRAVASIDLGAGGTFGLVGLDGIVRLRVQDGKLDQNAGGMKLQPGTGLLYHVGEARTGHYWARPGSFDNVSRFVSYRVLGSYPLIATVTAPESEIYRRSDEAARTYWLIALLLTIAIAVAIRSAVVRERKLNAAIAEMKQAQAEMRTSQERYELVETAVHDGIWDKNILTGATYFSPRWFCNLGYAEGEVSKSEQAFFDLVHPADKASIEKKRREYLEGQSDQVHAIEFRLRHKDGSYRWIQGRGKALRDANGRPLRMLGTITDITERKQTQAAIEETNVRLARAEAMAHLGHIKYEKASGLYTWSDGIYRIMGKFPDSFTPTLESSLELIHPDDRLALALYRSNVLSGLAEAPITVRTVDVGGQTKYLEVWSAPLHNSSGTVAGMFGTVQDVTEKKLAEADLTESHANLAHAEAMILLGHYKYDVATNVTTWSSGAYRVYGKSPHDFTPTKAGIVALFHPDDRAEIRRYQEESLKGKSLSRLTSRIVKDDGEIAIVESWTMPTRDNNGNTIGYFGTVQDVTERFRADAAVNESRENLARAEAMVLLGHSKTDIYGNYTWSAGLFRIMGKSPEIYTPTGESARELIHPDDRAAHAQYSRDVMAGVDVPRTSLRMIRDDGEIIHVELWSVPIRDKDGAVTGKFSTLQDVTALRRTEALINESYANLERAERMALLGHYKIDRGTGNLVWSNGIFRIFGLSRDTFKPTLSNAMELVHPDDRHFLKEIRNNAMSGFEVPHVTLRAIRDDGAVIDVEYWATPVRDSDGNITGVFGTLQDITIRKRAEEALARANQELEARVGERTAELAMEMRRREEAQMTLGQMQKMEAVGQLTAGIAHDFNNLLAVIGGSLEFVDGAAARGLTAEPELIDAALRATRRGRELVRRLLAFSRQSPLRAEATNIDQLVLDTLRLLQRTLGQGIDMVTQLDARAAVISVDRNQMANALLNLALNARDAMPDGGQLTIATTCRPASAGSARFPTGEEVCIVISDTGVGMNNDVRGRAFEPFFTTKPDGLGSGLGLSMVQGFVEQSGGKIDIDSAPGNGTTITIVLPRVASESRADEADPTGGISANGREKTVLLVEDDPDVRVVTAAQLRHLGYKVHAVANGMEAIDLISSPANIDITLTDIVLPGGLDGVELIKEAIRARPKMGVLCMSGYDPTQKHRKWLKVQNIDFLEKPFSSSRLAQALDAALAH